MLLRIYFFIFGYAEIYIRGFSCGRVINMVKNGGLSATDVKAVYGGIRFKALRHDIKRIDGMCRKAGCVCEVIYEKGLPVFLGKVRVKCVFTLGALFFCLFLLTATRFIWLVEVRGNLRVPTGKILDFCGENNLKYGVKKSLIDTNELEKSIKNEFEDISFVSVSISGTRALIAVSETIPKDGEKSNTGLCDIVSDSKAIITKVTVRSGKPVVKEGMAVNAGDMLINGDVDIKAEQEVLGTKAAGAEGEVFGRVTEKYSFEVPFEESVKKYYSKSRKMYAINIFNKNFSINCNKNGTNIKKCDKIESKDQLRLWNDIYLPFIVTKTEYIPYDYEKRRLNLEQAKAKAGKIVTAEIINKYDAGSSVLDKKIAFKQNEKGLFVTAEVVVNRQIGVFKKYEREETDGEIQNRGGE